MNFVGLLQQPTQFLSGTRLSGLPFWRPTRSFPSSRQQLWLLPRPFAAAPPHPSLPVLSFPTSRRRLAAALPHLSRLMLFFPSFRQRLLLFPLPHAVAILHLWPPAPSFPMLRRLSWRLERARFQP